MNSICCFSIEHTIPNQIPTNCLTIGQINRKCCRTSSICCVSIEFVQVTPPTPQLHMHWSLNFDYENEMHFGWRFGINSPDSEPTLDVRSTVWPILGNSLWPHSPAIPWVSGVQSTVGEIRRKFKCIVISSIGASTVNKLNPTTLGISDEALINCLFHTRTHSQSLLRWACEWLHSDIEISATELPIYEHLQVKFNRETTNANGIQKRMGKIYLHKFCQILVFARTSCDVAPN